MRKALVNAAKRSLSQTGFSLRRALAVSTTKENIVFDRSLKSRHRDFALSETLDTSYYNYLRQESNYQIIDRINDINKEFPVGLEIGCFDGELYRLINGQPSLRGSSGGCGGIDFLVQTDLSTKAKQLCISTLSELEETIVKNEFVKCDEGFLPFQSNSFDIVLSSLSLHWSNDLFKTFSEINRILKPDGVFIASLLGNDSLKELRNCLYLAEQERRGGISYHTSPFMRTWDIAGLMQDANFNLPTVDIDSVKVREQFNGYVNYC